MPDAPESTMPAPAQPPGDPWAYASQYDDIDAQAAHFEGFGQHYEQLSAGPFQGRFESYQFGDELTIHLERANRELMQSASTPRDRFGFSVIAPGSPPCVLNGQHVDAGDLVLYPAGATIEGTTPEGVRIFCVDMEADPPADGEAGWRDIRIVRDPIGSEAIRHLLIEGIRSFGEIGSPAALRAAATDFRNQLSEQVWHVAAGGADERRRRRSQALAICHRARELLAAELAEGVSITEVCRMIGVSRRTLESAFQAVIGKGPAQYVRTLQLNRVRRDLLCAGYADASIGAIAARHGVWHWSRFSHSYRMMFGELPSETRRRA
jgi:AraC family transcriptional regulator, ethanolamine operon transcriptional activator